jgi:hypothetical protein
MNVAYYSGFRGGGRGSLVWWVLLHPPVFLFFRGVLVWGCFPGPFVVWRVFLVYFMSRLLLNSPCIATELLGGWFPGVFLVSSGVWLCFQVWMLDLLSFEGHVFSVFFVEGVRIVFTGVFSYLSCGSLNALFCENPGIDWRVQTS